MPSGSRSYAVIALVASLLGLLFASNSTLDYASHLDRHLHEVHCSFIPGAAATNEAEACRAAMYSPYSALLKEAYWGGIPISLFAMGAFAFFVGFSLYLLMAGGRAPRGAVLFFSAVSLTPFLVSALMFIISLTKLGHLCKTCVGIYISSTLLLISGVMGFLSLRGPFADAEPRPRVGVVMPVAWLLALGLTTLVPAVVYAASVPDQRPFLTQCGTLKVEPAPNVELVQLRGARAVQPALLFEDPLCPTCKAFHERLVGEGVYERLDARLSLFPLDSECNWMLNEPLHPGACIVAKAVLCGGERARDVLEWAYDQQSEVQQAGKAGPKQLKSLIRARFGDAITRCIDERKTETRLNNHLHFASDNNIPVSTPQVYLGKQRLCDEDTDLGLRFTLGQLAPEVLK
ncbi:MAG: vitamin K epoxide reductase family protein [Polyangiaceae bacterium]